MKILDKSLDVAYQLYNQELSKPQVFCFIYDGNKLLSIGQNEMETENAKALYFGKRYKIPHLIEFPFIHAEVDAIAKLWGKHKIIGTEKVVVVRLKKSGTTAKERKIILPALAKPCDSCYNVLTPIGLRRVWYSTETNFEIL